MYGNSSLSCFFQTYLTEHGTSPEYLLGSKRKTFVNTFHYPSHLRLPLGLPVRKRRTSILSKEKKKTHQHRCLLFSSFLETLTMKNAARYLFQQENLHEDMLPYIALPISFLNTQYIHVYLFM